MNRSKVNEVIDKIISTPTKTPSKEEAAEALRSCGVLDKDNNLNPAYREIIKSKQDEYISRRNLLAKFPEVGEPQTLDRKTVHLIIATEPAADVIEVVRCKNCGNYCENTGECNKYGHHPGEDGYCSGAIQKEREN